MKDIQLLDGAMGTMVMRAGLSEDDFRGERFASHPRPLKGCNDVLCLTRPDIIADIHRRYLEAGADIISTDTFNANRLSLEEYGLGDMAAEIAREGARIARGAVEAFYREGRRRPKVAGSMGPSGIALSVGMQESENPAEDFDRMAEAYREQAVALMEGGVDMLLLETVFDTLNAKAAIYGIKKAFRDAGREVPLMVSATLSENGRLLSGQSLREFVEATSHAGATSYGLNCGFGAEALLPRLKELRDTWPGRISFHPNAGLPDALGRYGDTPEKMADELRPAIESGLVDIVGGCCGTTPEHIAVLRALLDEPRAVNAAEPGQECSPSDPVNEAGCRKSFLKIGERCNVAGSRKFLRLAKEGKWGECLDIAADQIGKGAGMLDINMDDAMLDAPATMTSFLRRLAADSRTASVPVMVDSSDFEVIRRALRMLPLRGIVNSISLKNGEEEFLERAREIGALGCGVVVMAFDEKGQADTLERRQEICSRAYRLLTEKAGYRGEDIIFDPNVLAVATGIEAHDRYALSFLESVVWIKENLPGAKVSGGVSNLSFSFRGIDPVRKAMHSLFLEHAIARGMDMAIINPATPLDGSRIAPELRRLVDDVLLCRRAGASESLLAEALRLKAEADKEKAVRLPEKPRQTENTRSFRSLLAAALTAGETEDLDELVDKALEECGGVAMAVIDSALMKGMDEVGERFSRGEMFLPQVVRSAGVMKRAVSRLTPLLEAQAASGTDVSAVSGRRCVVLATVKGDVHDIGKNIVAVVLRCGGWDVIDLGVMVEPEVIVDKAIESGAVAIGLSGLITPSLEEMGRVATMMEERAMKIPLFVGGATTSDLHTAVKLAPLYSGPVAHTAAAAALPGAVSQFTGPEAAEAVAELRERQRELRRSFETSVPGLSLEEARSRKAPVTKPAPVPAHPGHHELWVELTALEELVNWRALLSEWKVAPDSEEAVRLVADARELLCGLDGRAHGRVAILPARSEGDTIVIRQKKTSITISTARGRRPDPRDGRCRALSDYVCSDGDYVGVFVMTLAGSGVPEMVESIKESDPYRTLLLQSLSHRLAEAATEWMHRYVRSTLWEAPENIPGVRPAVGYASLPDQRLVFELDKVLDYSALGVSLTEHGALSPTATTTGLLLFHPSARYL